jgi:hypothetical protein
VLPVPDVQRGSACEDRLRAVSRCGGRRRIALSRIRSIANASSTGTEQVTRCLSASYGPAHVAALRLISDLEFSSSLALKQTLSAPLRARQLGSLLWQNHIGSTIVHVLDFVSCT